MTVSARTAIDLPPPATVEAVDLRFDPSVRAGTFPWDGPDVETGWHRHPYHQVEYALEGVAEVRTPAARYLLPPQQAIWIPAGVPHATTLRGVRSVAAFFDPGVMPEAGDRACVLAAAPVVREMLRYALRWPIWRTGNDAEADAFFVALGAVVRDWIAQEVPLSLPTTADPVVAEIMAYTDANLDTVTTASVCRAVGVSERTLRRRFADVIGQPWRAYVLQSRLLRAMAMLADSPRNIADVSTSVGFDSPSAFTRAFQRWCGESPSAYRRRVRAAREDADGPGPVARRADGG